MQIIADLHLHSHYSRAVSPQMNLFENARWAAKKGIDLIATADWTHPLWFREMITHLEESRPGIYRLKDQSQPFAQSVSFLLSTEISNIYFQGGKSRRIHNLLFAPSLQAVETMNKKLAAAGAKLMADGRPIVGISSIDLLEMALSIDENFMLIPAHAWTPWYGVFGSQSGFDSIQEAFGSLAKHIYAVESGLSSDPAMNWQVKELESRSIVSFSDAHSGPKLGREATVFIKNLESTIQKSEYSYNDITEAIRKKAGSALKIGYTIEFFPEEGKYHWSGHRDCGIRYNATEVKEKGTICPVCKRSLTIGVENRVLDLSGNNTFSYNHLTYKKNSSGTTFVSDQKTLRPPFVSLIPLLEILMELHNQSPTRSKVAYEDLISTLGSEFDILLTIPYEALQAVGGSKLTSAIQIVRERKAIVDPGYDGVFGKVKIFPEVNQETTTPKVTATQQTLF